MMTNVEVAYLNEILHDIPFENTFRVSDLVRELFNRPEFIVFREMELKIRNDSSEITNFLVEKGFVVYEGTGFFDHTNESRLIRITEKGRELINSNSYQNYAKDQLQEQNQLQRLDWVLEYMTIHAVQGRDIESSWTELKKTHPTIHVEFLESYRQQMINKLVDDGYLEYNEGTCRITLNGVLFYDGGEGGYIAGDKKNRHNTKVKTLKDNLLLGGTYVAGISAFLLFVAELLKYYKWIGTVAFMTTFCICLLGIGAGMIIYHLVLRVIDQSDKDHYLTVRYL